MCQHDHISIRRPTLSDVFMQACFTPMMISPLHILQSSEYIARPTMQDQMPDKSTWFVVTERSADGTLNIVKDLSSELPFTRHAFGPLERKTTSVNYVTPAKYHKYNPTATHRTLRSSAVVMDGERVISILRRAGHAAMTPFRKTDRLSSVFNRTPECACTGAC